jgi:hypothetical protein
MYKIIKVISLYHTLKDYVKKMTDWLILSYASIRVANIQSPVEGAR